MPTTAAPTVALNPAAARAVGGAMPLRIVAISDTHEMHWELTGHHDSGVDFLPPGDVLVHCGDIFRGSRKAESAEFVAKLQDFNDWLGTVKDRYRHGVLVIAGNHDIALQRYGAKAVQRVLTNATYLEWAGVTIAGVSFFGCPLSFGRSCNRGFQDYPCDFDVQRALPTYTDVLISHGSWANDGWLDRCVKFPSPNGGVSQPPPGVRCRLNIAGHDHDVYGARVIDLAPTYGFAPDAVVPMLKSTPSLVPPSFPLPQIAGLGLIAESSAADQTYKRYVKGAEELTGGRVSQPDVVAAFSTACNKAAAAKLIGVRSQCVCVVASNMDMKYLIAHRPIEIDIWPSPSVQPQQPPVQQQHPCTAHYLRRDPAAALPLLSEEYQRVLVNGALPVPVPRSSKRI